MYRCQYFAACFLCLFKIDAATFEVDMVTYSQDITKKPFQQQFMVPHKQTLLRNMQTEKKAIHILFNTVHMKNHFLLLIVFLWINLSWHLS